MIGRRYDSTDPEDQVYPFSSEEMRLKLTGNVSILLLLTIGIIMIILTDNQ